jgi:6-phosphogluconolactonase
MMIKNVIVANYSWKHWVFGKNRDGSIEAKKQVQHYGKGSNASRQEGPHVHMVQFLQTSLFYRMI